MNIEIDSKSGFCFGVTRAISKAEEELNNHGQLYCLGDIVHNGKECDRLQSMGLDTIDHEAMRNIRHTKVLLRAHGEPPSTYALAESQDIEIIDATCPVVLHLQGLIKKEYSQDGAHRKQIVIFGKKGHAEVMGLVGQTEGHAIIIESPADLDKIDLTRDVCLFSQTTKPLQEFRQIVKYLSEHISPDAVFTYHDTICRQVANRIPHIRTFAGRHDVILFVSGRESSNGSVLFKECLAVNPHSYMIDTATEIVPSWFDHCESLGICGATSTPTWLMLQCKTYVEELLRHS